VVASRSMAITVKPARIPYSVAVKRPSFCKSLKRTLSIRPRTQNRHATALLGRIIKRPVKAELQPKIATVGSEEQTSAALDHIR
jgi:hypothetical protein